MKNKIFAALILGGLFLQPLTWAEEKPVIENTDLLPIEFATNDSTNLTQTTPASTASQAPTSSIQAIGTVRPSFTDAAITVPKGSLQVESGATYTNNSDDTTSWVLPESLFRLGITENTEIRYSTPNYTHLQGDATGTLINNFGDTSVGFAHHILLPREFHLMVIPILNLPTGANAASSNAIDPQLRVVWGKQATPKLFLSGQLDTRWFTSSSATTDTLLNPTFIGYYTFHPKLTGFLEYASFIPTTGKMGHYIQSGLLYLAAKRHQFDARIAAGLNDAASDLIVGFGYSFRLDGLFSKK